ncbi:MAG: dTMP kinase, partial [Marinirhabdus sp.]
TTQIEILKSRFKKLNLKVHDTHEPSDGPIGMLIRNSMKGRIQTDQSTLAALFATDRLDHINNPINGMKKRLEQGYNIICSRYYFSNYAFQSEYVPIKWLVQINSLSKTYIKPDLTIYLNVDPRACNNRITTTRVDIEMYETLEKLTKTHHAYLNYFKQYGKDENIHIIDGNRSINDISNDIWKITQTLIAIPNKDHSVYAR